MVGVPMLKAERISRSGPKLSDAQTRNFEAIKYNCVSTVGLNESTIRKYIREQESADIALDRLSVKEYEDPFAGR